MTLAEEFEQFLKEKHLKECAQCRREGKAILQDGNLVAILLFREFCKEKNI